MLARVLFFTLAALLFTLKAILRFAEGFRISLEQNIANWRQVLRVKEFAFEAGKGIKSSLFSSFE